jgi:aldehyde dehydrogenase (NAD+)
VTAPGPTFAALDPFTGEAWAEVPECDAADVDRAVAAARGALSGEWGSLTAAQRGEAMQDLAAVLAEEAEKLALVESRGNGKLLRETSAQAASLPGYFRYFAGLADKIEGTTVPTAKPGHLLYTLREPVGVVAAVVAWNSPLLLLTWKLAPALAAGCPVVAKPSPFASVSTIALGECFERAGFPAGVFGVVTGSGAEVSEALVTHPGVDKVAFTGSTETGIAVGRAALGHLARLSLELGGKSAQLVFGDADLDAATQGLLAGVFAATGQTCVAGSRLLVQRPVAADLLERLRERASRILLGDPRAAATEMGPLANAAQLEKVSAMVERARGEGATVLCGGRVSEELGALFYEPTILTDVTPEMEIAREEVFGPVLAVMTFDDEAEAVALANDSDYGLAAGIWSESVRRCHRVAAALHAGTVWINTYRVMAPYAPFGGLGMSGVGRENGIEAVREYTELKSVWTVTDPAAPRDPFTLA